MAQLAVNYQQNSYWNWFRGKLWAKQNQPFSSQQITICKNYQPGNPNLIGIDMHWLIVSTNVLEQCWILLVCFGHSIFSTFYIHFYAMVSRIGGEKRPRLQTSSGHCRHTSLRLRASALWTKPVQKMGVGPRSCEICQNSHAQFANMHWIQVALYFFSNSFRWFKHLGKPASVHKESSKLLSYMFIRSWIVSN